MNSNNIHNHNNSINNTSSYVNNNMNNNMNNNINNNMNINTCVYGEICSKTKMCGDCCADNYDREMSDNSLENFNIDRQMGEFKNMK